MADEGPPKSARYVLRVGAVKTWRDGRLQTIIEHRLFFSIIPLVTWLRRVEGCAVEQRPTNRATFVVDDPNLRCLRYGHLDFAKVVTSAKRNHYHVCVATIPLDLSSSSALVVRHFRQNSAHLSLCIHGNNHTKMSLAGNIRAHTRQG